MPKKFEVVETLRRVVPGGSWEEINQKYADQEIVLDSEDFLGYEINEITGDEEVTERGM